MTLISDQDYLKNQQYQASGNLRARMSIHQRFSRNACGWQQWVFDHLHLQPGMRVLELGCGMGVLWLENLARLPEKIEIVLSDFSTGMLTVTQKQLEGDKRFRFTQLDAQAIALKSQQFDVVVANHMLYHVPDLSQSLREIRRVLNVDGHLAAGTNGNHHMQELYDLIRLIFPEFMTSNDSASHFGLQNGDALLASDFTKRELFLYPDSLWITETQPLVAYITSMWGLWKLEKWNSEKQNRLEELISAQIHEKGGISVQKSTGMFWAGSI